MSTPVGPILAGALVVAATAAVIALAVAGPGSPTPAVAPSTTAMPSGGAR